MLSRAGDLENGGHLSPHFLKLDPAPRQSHAPHPGGPMNAHPPVSSSVPRPCRLSGRARPELETLEDRTVPSTVAGSYSDGTWRYDATAGWTHLSSFQPNLLDVDDAGDVYAKYSTGVAGLWRWSASSTSWAKLSDLTVNQFQVTASGVLYGDFGTMGTWRWSPSSGWMQLTNNSPVTMAVSDSDALFGRYDMGVVGTWRWTPAGGWSMPTANRPDILQTDAQGDLVGVYNTYIDPSQKGTWRWSPTSGWTRLDSVVANFIATSANGTIYEDRGSSGLWYAGAGMNSFTMIDPLANIATDLFSLRALPDGSVYYEYLNTTVPHYHGWYWNPNLQGLGIVNIIADTGFINMGFAGQFGAVGKDNDLFFEEAPGGPSGSGGATGSWSLQSAYHSVGNKITYFLASQR
jgi:hypothetical protein